MRAWGSEEQLGHARYNATVYRSNADGRHVSTFIAEVDELGFMLRSNSVQCSGYEGTRQYAYLHRMPLTPRARLTADITRAPSRRMPRG